LLTISSPRTAARRTRHGRSRGETCPTGLLATIAEKEAAAAGEPARDRLVAEARDYRRRAREARRSFAGTRYVLRPHLQTVVGAVIALQDPEQRTEFEQRLHGLEAHGWTALASAVRRILAGEREVDALCQGLDAADSLIVDAILQGIEDPILLQELMEEAEPPPVG